MQKRGMHLLREAHDRSSCGPATASRFARRVRWRGLGSAWAALSTCLALLGCQKGPAAPPAQPAANPPAHHVVVYLIDTLRADRLGAYGYDRAATPNIDRLAESSVVFANASAPAPWTLPSVVSILTSSYPYEHRVFVAGRRIGKDLSPLAERFKTLGCATASFINNAFVGAASGLDRGCDVCTLMPGQTFDPAAIDHWLGSIGNRRAFLYVHTVEPHTPYQPPMEFLERFGDVKPSTVARINGLFDELRELQRVDFVNHRPRGTTDNTAAQQRVMAELEAMLPQLRAVYDAEVAYADRNVGMMIDMLKRRGMWDDTVFVLLADHGEEFDEHGGWLHGQSVYNELVHVPLIIHFPGSQHAGRRLVGPANLLDVMPTLADALDRPALGAKCRGRSLMPLLKADGPPPAGTDEFVSLRADYQKYNKPAKERRGDVNLALRRDHYKGIWNLEAQTFELYDLVADPGEANDLSEVQPETAGAMLATARKWLEAHPDAFELGTGDIGLQGASERDQQNLRDLGYIK